MLQCIQLSAELLRALWPCAHQLALAIHSEDLAESLLSASNDCPVLDSSEALIKARP